MFSGNAFAIITYERTPAGFEITSPVSFEISFDDFLGDTELVECGEVGGETCNYWGVSVRQDPDPFIETGECYASTTLSGIFDIDLPVGYNGHAVGLYGWQTQELCENNSESNGATLEYNGGNFIFTINF